MVFQSQGNKILLKKYYFSLHFECNTDSHICRAYTNQQWKYCTKCVSQILDQSNNGNIN